MFKKIMLALTSIGTVGGLTVYIFTIPVLRRLPKQSRVSMDGITTIDDAVVKHVNEHSCKDGILLRMPKILLLKNLPTPASTPGIHLPRHLSVALGYCEQQALALKKMYDKLGIETRPVFAMRCKFPAKVVDGVRWPGGISGHAWLRVRIGDKELDVCSGSVKNTPGVTQF